MATPHHEVRDAAPIEGIRPEDLPAPPEVAMQIMRACARAETTSRQLAALVENDPALTAEILRIVNSPLYGLSRKVRDIGKAVTVLGQQYLRNMVLCIAVRDSLRGDTTGGMDVSAFWGDALRRAVAASELGKVLGMDRHECFTAGLLQDYGMLVLFHLFPQKAGEWPAMRVMDPEQRWQREKALFGLTHDRIMMILAQAWGLPDELGIPLGHHHQVDDPALVADQLRSCQVLAGADWLASCYTAGDTRHAVIKTRELLQQLAGMEAARTDALLAAIPEQVATAAHALGLGVPDAGDFDQIMQAANAQLVEQNLEFQDLTLRLQKAIRERDALAAELESELRMAREVQQALLPDDDDPLPVHGVNLNARQLSGDFYDYFEVPQQGIQFILADVSGKGANAALLMAKTSSLFRCLGKRIHDPGELLTVINHELCETSVHGMFVTLVAGRYRPDSGELMLVNAGHPPALLIDSECAIEEVQAGFPPLGIVDATRYTSSRIVLGERSLYLYSDGVTEGRMTNGKVLGNRGLRTLLCRVGRLPPDRRLAALASQFHQQGFELHDDVTILLIEGRQPCPGLNGS